MRWFAILVLCLSACVQTGRGVVVAPRVTIAPSFRSGAAFERVAVYVENNSNRQISPGVFRTIEEEFLRALVEKGYVIASRSDQTRVQGEINFQSSRASEPEKLAQMGRMLNVSAILLVSVNDMDTQQYSPAFQTNGRQYFHTHVDISSRLLSASQAEVLLLSSYQQTYPVSGYNSGSEALPWVARVVASGIPRRSVPGNQPF
jgi:hypothetical protein